ncbi:MAG: hypothetical protein WA160_14305 [Pseudobdellovibrio sp.]
MNKNLGLLLVAAANILALSSCDKGGSNFSVLAASSQFQQASTFTPRKLDVLFVVDNSGSMSTSQANLVANFPSFINYFKNKGYDFRIAVTTTDAFYGDQFISNGCTLCNVNQTKFRAGASGLYIVDNNTSNLESVFTQNALVGTSGSGDERAFSSFKAALSSSLNVGFHRADAFLSVIIVSDADDFSHDTITFDESYAQATLHPVSNYVNFLDSFTNGHAVNDYSVSTIGVLDSACRSQSSENKISTRYMNLSDLTGGSKNSICNSFATVLDNISTSIATQTQASFHLTRSPTESSIRVIIDGVVVPQSSTNGWSYNSSTNTITINGSTYQPQSGSSITINFDPATI